MSTDQETARQMTVKTMFDRCWPLYPTLHAPTAIGVSEFNVREAIDNKWSAVKEMVDGYADPLMNSTINDDFHALSHTLPIPCALELVCWAGLEWAAAVDCWSAFGYSRLSSLNLVARRLLAAPSLATGWLFFSLLLFSPFMKCLLHCKLLLLNDTS